MKMPPEPPNLTIHAKVYALGEKYDVSGLKAIALQKFKKESAFYWDNDDFLRALEEVCKSIAVHDRPMRDAILDIIMKHPELLDKEPAQSLVRNNDLCFDLIMRFRGAYRPSLFFGSIS